MCLGGECSKGWLFICGFMSLINFVTSIFFFHFMALSLLLESFFLRARFSRLNFNGIFFLNGEMQCLLSFARPILLVLFTSLKSKMFPLRHANINGIMNPSVKLRFLHSMRGHLQVRSRCVADTFGSKQRLASWKITRKIYYTSSDGVTM